MKIIYLHQYFHTPDMQGSTRSYQMAKRMVEAGHEVHMVTSRKDGYLTGKIWVTEQVDGINVHWLPVRYDNTMSYFERVVAFFKFALKAGKKSVEIGGDIIFATSTPLTIAIPAVKAKKKLNIPLVFEVRDLWPELPIAMGALKSPVTQFLAKKLEKYAYFNSEHVVGLSPGMSEGVVKSGYPSKDVTTIPNSCDVAEFNKSDVDGQTFRSSRKWLGDKPLVIYAGTLGHINGVSWLCDLASKVLPLNPEIRFLILGEGVDKDKIIERAKTLNVYNKNIFIESQIAKKDMPDALKAATVCTSLFLPIKEMWNNSANKFFDALAAGRPVCINYNGWQKELIEKNNLGLVLDYHDLDKSAQQLVSLLDDELQLKECGANALNTAKNDFSRDKLAQQLIHILETVEANNSNK